MLRALRRYALTGLLVLAPAALTFSILYSIVTWLDAFFITFIPLQYQPQNLFGFNLPGTGLVAATVLVVLVGMFARNMLGRWLVMQWERLLEHIPGVKSIYGAIKQILETLTATNSEAFKDVVLVEYPRKGMWAIGFTTGQTRGQVQRKTDAEMINVFLPTTPNPTSGFLLFVPRAEAVYLDMTVEQGVKMVISAGMVTPSTAEGQAALQAQHAYNAKLAQNQTSA